MFKPHESLHSTRHSLFHRIKSMMWAFIYFRLRSDTLLSSSQTSSSILQTRTQWGKWLQDLCKIRKNTFPQNSSRLRAHVACHFSKLPPEGTICLVEVGWLKLNLLYPFIPIGKVENSISILHSISKISHVAVIVGPDVLPPPLPFPIHVCLPSVSSTLSRHHRHALHPIRLGLLRLGLGESHERWTLNMTWFLK